jgi:NADH-quinone oxidoreductase subunit G
VVLVLDLPQVELQAAGAVVYLGTVRPEDKTLRAEVLLPVANVAEEEGTFVNRDGRVQRYYQARPAPGMAEPAWWVLAGLRAARGAAPLASAAEAFAALAREVPAFEGLSYARLGYAGDFVAKAVPA